MDGYTSLLTPRDSLPTPRFASYGDPRGFPGGSLVVDLRGTVCPWGCGYPLSAGRRWSFGRGVGRGVGTRYMSVPGPAAVVMILVYNVKMRRCIQLDGLGSSRACKPFP